MRRGYSLLRRPVPALLAGLVVLTGCGTDSVPTDGGPADSAARAISATVDNEITFDGATLRLPAGSLDRDTTVRITKAAQTAPDGSTSVQGYEFEVGDAKIIKPVEVVLPVLETAPAVTEDGQTIVPFLSGRVWGTRLGSYNAVNRTVTVRTEHLSFWTDLGSMVWQGVRKVLGEVLGGFRGEVPDCGHRAGPLLNYPLGTMFEPPLLVCATGTNDSGTLKVVNNRGFFLDLQPQSGLALRELKPKTVMDNVATATWRAYNIVADKRVLMLPPQTEAELDYRAVEGGPILTFRPNPPATVLAAVLATISGLSDKAEAVRMAYDCLAVNPSMEQIGECAAKALLDRAVTEVKVSGVTISRNLFGALGWVLKAMPVISLIENHDHGSTGQLGLDAVPPRTPPATGTAPSTQVPPSVASAPPAPPAPDAKAPSPTTARPAPPAQTTTTPPVTGLVIDVDRYCREQDGAPAGTEAVNPTDHAYGWRCRNPETGKLTDVDMNVACQKQHPTVPGVEARNLTDAANSWICVQP